ncbi:MAG: response regulator [Saprospirales bacterium]|nr:MAG: response regulator [Saprospirales bacterium]
MVTGLVRHILLCLWLTIVPWGVVASQEYLVHIDDHYSDFMSLQNCLLAMADLSGTYTPDDFIERDFEQFYEAAHPDLDQYEYPLHIWYFTELINETDQRKDFILESCFCADSLIVYEITEGKVTGKSISGMALPPSQKSYPHFANFTSLSLEPQQQKKILIRSFYNSQLPRGNILGLWEPNRLLNIVRYESLTSTFYAGIMIVFSVLGLVAFMLFRERVFVFFSLMSISFMLYFTQQFKVIPSLVHFKTYGAYYNFHTFTIGLMLVVTFLFVSSYIRLRKEMPGYYYFYGLLTVIFSSLWLTPIYGLEDLVSIQIRNYLLIIWLVVSLVPTIYLSFRGIKQAKYLLFASLFMVLAFGFYILGLLNVIPRGSFQSYIVLIGTTCFFTLLIFGLFQRVKTIIREKQELSNVSRLKSRFFANISHEFRTPLTLIMGPTGQLLEREKDPEKKKLLNTSMKYARKMLNMVNDLLELSRSETNNASIRVSKGDFYHFSKGIVLSFETLAEGQNISLSYSSTAEDPELWFDAEKMEAILTNLISNAFKFTEPGGEISVKLSDNPNQLILEVADNGIGIPSEKLDHIFDRFFQAENKVESTIEGSGIGLAIVREFVELHKGSIEVKSEVGQGTTFTLGFIKGKKHLVGDVITIESERIQIPEDNQRRDDLYLEESDEVTSAEKAGAVLPTQGTAGSATILIVEDNSDVRSYIRSQFKENYHVLEAADGRDGIEMAIEHLPHLIISDVMMPHKNGFELCEILKKDVNTSHIPIVLLTAKSEQNAKLEGLEYGADDYLTKPFNSKELELRVRNLIDNRLHIRKKILQSPELAYHGVKTSPVEREFLQKVSSSIEENLDNPQFGVPALAKKVGLSQAQLNRKLKSLANLTAGKYIQHIRLNKALEMLKTGKYNVSEVGTMIGFNSNAYFVKTFKEQFGQTPGSLINDS